MCRPTPSWQISPFLLICLINTSLSIFHQSVGNQLTDAANYNMALNNDLQWRYIIAKLSLVKPYLHCTTSHQPTQTLTIVTDDKGSKILILAEQSARAAPSSL